MKRTLPVLGVVLLVGSGVVVQLPVVEPVAMWWDLGRPPHPWLTTSTDAAQQLQTTPPELQFEHTFYYGETCGRLETLEASTARGEQVPESLRLHFYDGLGHGLSLVDQTADEMVVQIDRFVQPVYRRNLYEGILRAYTEASAAEPDQVVPFAEAFVAQVGLDDPYNGVRIGLQRALGDDLPMAITTAQRYPQRYWPALYEELGWRSVVPRPTPPDHVFEAGPFAGQPSSRALVSYAALVPEDARCHFVHGAMRGRILERHGLDPTGWTAIASELALLDERCLAAGYQGVAWGIAVLAGHETPQAEWWMSQVGAPDARARVKRSYERITGADRTPGSPARRVAPWELAPTDPP